MPQPASSRSLEDILASIRKSLADETVDGLVELSAAAAAAARAEAPVATAATLKSGKTQAAPLAATISPPLSAADALADDLLRDKLAGALGPEGDEAGDDLADLLAEPQAALKAVPEIDVDTLSPEGAALSKIWVLRPGRQVSENSDKAGDAPAFELDPFAGNEPSQGASEASAVFSLSPRDLIGDAHDARTPVATTASLATARLDPENVALLNKLRASNAAAIEKMAQSIADEAEEENPPAAEPVVAVASEPIAATDEVFPEAGMEPDPLALDDEAASPRLSMPERSTPLFGATIDAGRPIVTSGVAHLLPNGVGASLQPEAASTDAPAEAASAIDDASLIEPSAALTAASADIAQEAATPSPVEDATAEPLPAHALLDGAAAGNTKALEDMIAAVLEPVLQKLIETSIAPTLELLVRQEVARALQAQRAAD